MTSPLSPPIQDGLPCGSRRHAVAELADRKAGWIFPKILFRHRVVHRRKLHIGTELATVEVTQVPHPLTVHPLGAIVHQRKGSLIGRPVRVVGGPSLPIADGRQEDTHVRPVEGGLPADAEPHLLLLLVVHVLVGAGVTPAAGHLLDLGVGRIEIAGILIDHPAQPACASPPHAAPGPLPDAPAAPGRDGASGRRTPSPHRQWLRARLPRSCSPARRPSSGPHRGPRRAR